MGLKAGICLYPKCRCECMAVISITYTIIMIGVAGSRCGITLDRGTLLLAEDETARLWGIQAACNSREAGVSSRAGPDWLLCDILAVQQHQTF